jgi:hypothetical protein
MPRPKFESKVDSFVAEGAQPKTLRHGGVVLKSKQSGLFVTLVKPSGCLTNAGAYYPRVHNGELNTEGLDLFQVPHREKIQNTSIFGEEESIESLGRDAV